MKPRKSNMPLYEKWLAGQLNDDGLPSPRNDACDAAVDITSVIATYESVPDDSFFSKLTDVVPPFKTAWLEWRMDAIKEHRATHVFAIDGRDSIRDTIANHPFIDGVTCETHEALNDLHDDTRWLLYVTTYGQCQNGWASPTPLVARKEIFRNGSPRDDISFIGPPEWFSNPKYGGLVDQVHYTLCVTLFALSLMNCRNIGHQEHEGVALQKRQGRKPKKWKYTYRTLTIKPLSASKSGGSSDGEPSGNTAMHFCRGNFATYTEEKPLFGKYVGKFWRPAHLKGKATAGVVDKDYAIEMD